MKALTRISVVCAVVLVGFLLLSQRGFTQGDGKSVFMAKSCNNCHTVKSLNIQQKKGDDEGKPSDLSKAGAQHDANWFKGWLMKTETVKGKKHKKAWKGTDAELNAVSTWLSTLK